MYRPVLITAPTATPVSLEEAVAHLRLDAEDEDDLVEGLINAATAYLDGFFGVLGRCLVTQTWRQDFDNFDTRLNLPQFPVASISSVTYLDTAAASQTVAAASYALLHDDHGAYARFDDLFTFPPVVVEHGPRVSVTYVAGTAVASVPQAIKQAILLLVGHWYEQRATVNVGNITTELEFTVNALIAPYRRIRF